MHQQIPPRKPPRDAGGRAARPIREDLVLQACLEAYGLIRREGRLADRALEFTLRRKTHLYSSERRAVADRVYSLLRCQLTLDYLLARAPLEFAHRSASEQDLLRLSASQILQGESLKVVAEASGLRGKAADFLQNLPKAVSKLEGLPPIEAFSVKASLPPFLAERFMAQLGAAASAFAEAMNQRAPLTCRINTLKTDRATLQALLLREGVESRPTPYSPVGLFLDTRVNAFSLPPFKEGMFEMQDEGSQLLGLLVDAPPTRVVDACAGAGGKTLQLAAQMKNRGEIFALDVDEDRLSELRRRARRDGVHNVRTQLISAEGDEADKQLAGLKDKADRVLVDAPCSGTGTFRRKPDARYRLEPRDLENHVRRQKQLLERFSHLVKPGGRLVYGTCSILREENEAVVEDFLRLRSDFSILPAATTLGNELSRQLGCDPFLRLLTHSHGTDGFFGAILVREKSKSAG